jgi:hypothetical protein
MVFGYRKRGAPEDEIIHGIATGLSEDEKSSHSKDIGTTTSVEIGYSAEVQQNLESFRAFHALDANLPLDELDAVEAALQRGDVEREAAVERELLEDDSPYPEVRASVRNYDEDQPCNTIRAWTLGMILTTIGSGINMLFSLRNPSIYITTLVIQLVVLPSWDRLGSHHGP